MAYRTYPSPSDSQSPSTSANVSPETHTAPLDPMAQSGEEDFSGQSAHGTPSRPTTGLPRTQNSGKGGCWTCRVRRKKCDEQREGDSCKTCRRLTIKCLGWGAKRPDWMRDKKNVDAYKASIKSQLSRAGLIRGQPRHNPMQVPSPRSQPRHPSSAASEARSTPPITISHTDFSTFNQFQDTPYTQNESSLMPGMPGASNSTFDQLSVTSFNDLNGFDPNSMVYPFSPGAIPSGSTFIMDPLIEPNFLFPPGPDGLGYSDHPGMMSYGPMSQSSMHDELVMHYFSLVSRIQFIFAGTQVSEITYNTVLQESRGASAYAIYALADLHQTQQRVAQGLEAPQSAQASTAHYLYQEALFKLKSNRDNGNGWSESDAIAALHLVSYSHLSGGNADWQEPFDILCAWLLQSNLSLAGENTKTIFHSMSVASQLLVKLVMWLDIFSSLSLIRPPKFLNLWKSLLEENRLEMSSLTGCSDDALLALAEISQLAHWKASQIRNGTLSYPELVARGQVIQGNLIRHKTADLETQKLQNFGVPDKLPEGETPSDAHRAACVSIFREAALLYSHTILSNSSPGVPEIAASVDEIVRQFGQLPASNLDRALVFPICLAGCMTNDSNKRDYLKGRLQGLNEAYGNLLQTRLLMEALWQRRDVSGGFPDLREVIHEQKLSLLLI